METENLHDSVEESEQTGKIMVKEGYWQCGRVVVAYGGYAPCLEEFTIGGGHRHADIRLSPKFARLWIMVFFS